MASVRRSGRWVAATLAYLYARDGYRCARCLRWIDPALSGMHPRGGTVGHAIPLARGGTDELSNLRAEHRACNLVAGAREDDPAPTTAEPFA